MMATPFIILANQRSGSTFVRDMLGGHPEAKVYGELFMTAPARERPLFEPNDLEFARVFVSRRTRRGGPIARPYWTVRYLQQVFDQPGLGAAGMKLMYEQVRAFPETMVYATGRRIRVIHLLRRNLLDIVLSDKVRQRTGVWHVTSDGRPAQAGEKASLGDGKIHLDPDELVRSLNHLRHNQRVFRAWLAATRTPTLEVEYEQLVAHQERFGGILEFLGLDHRDWSILRTDLKKLNTKTHSELIENIGEIDARLCTTQFGGLVRY